MRWGWHPANRRPRRRSAASRVPPGGRPTWGAGSSNRTTGLRCRERIAALSPELRTPHTEGCGVRLCSGYHLSQMCLLGDRDGGCLHAVNGDGPHASLVEGVLVRVAAVDLLVD